VTLDENESPFDAFILKSMIGQSGLSRDGFHTCTKRTARKIGKAVRDQVGHSGLLGI